MRWLLAIVVLALAALAPAALAQTPLNISADNMTGSHGPEGDVVELSGNVRIVRGNTVITSQRGRYLRAQGMLFLEDRVKLVDSTTTVTCDRASYSEERDVIDLSGNVTLEDRDAVLEAPAATYDRRAGRAELYGGVRGNDGDRIITCERAYYWRDERLLQTRGNVVGRDAKNKLELRAASVDWDRLTDEAFAQGLPELRAEDEHGKTSVIRARTLKLNTETRLAEAVDSVEVVRDSLRARADYGLFDDQAQRGWLLGRPRAWDDETVVTGDTLELWTRERELERLVVRHQAAVDYAGVRPGTRGETSRLTGDRIDVFFAKEEIDSVLATGNAGNEYQGIPEAGKTAESNVSHGDTITVFFDRGKIDRARVFGSARGEYRLAVDVADTAAAAREIIQYDAARIDYIVSKNRIVLDGDAHLEYSNMELKSRRVVYDLDQQTLMAEGDPELVDRGEKVTGHMMTYDLETRVGNLYSAATTFERGLYHGRRIRKVGDKELDVMGGSYTTCDLEDPHYHFAARMMKIYLKDKLVAKPVVFYVKNVPLLALPFWIFPIKPGRHSGFLFPQFELGFTNRAGQFIRNAGYYWAPNDYMDLTLSGDYYQFEPSWVMRAEGNYRLRYVLDGDFRGSFARNENPENLSENWDLTASHNHDISPVTRLVARASFVSSKDYNSSNLYGRSLTQRLNRFLVSSLSLSHAADWASFSAAIDRRQDLDADVALQVDADRPSLLPPIGTEASLPSLTASTPNLSIGFPTRTLGSAPFLKGTKLEKTLSTIYFDFDTRFVSYFEQRGFVAAHEMFVDTLELVDSVAVETTFTTIVRQKEETRRGLSGSTSLSDSRRLFGWLNVQPSVFGSFVVFDFDELGNKVVPAMTWNSALTTSATFYGTFLPRLGVLEGIRHVITPTASFGYSPEFASLTFVDARGQQQNRFRGFSGISMFGRENFSMNFGINQRLQVKLKKGERIERHDNLVSWTMAGAYDFLYREHRLRHPLTPIASNLSIQPPNNFSANVAWITDVYNPRPVQSLGYNLALTLASGTPRQGDAVDIPLEDDRDPYADPGSLALGPPWSVDLTYSYSGGYPTFGKVWQSSQTANAVLRYRVTQNWALEYQTSYDVTGREIGIQRFDLIRDLHCWQATFRRTFAPGGEAEYWFRLGVKEQRELYVERGTRGGSLGGIN